MNSMVQQQLDEIVLAACEDRIAVIDALDVRTKTRCVALVITNISSRHVSPDNEVLMRPVAVLPEGDLTDILLPPHPYIEGAYGHVGQPVVYPLKGEH